MAKKSKFDFESALAELSHQVELMEEGDLSLEDSLKAFERGITLARECQNTLKNAEQKVQILLEENKKTLLTSYEPDEDEDYEDKTTV